ncbi:MAG: glycosyltransferase [Clostridium sp.]|uniref:glycosyltransferase n=1 Tax=Clostridium sp. TaxID=1506 RepID=UPI003F36361B
MNNNEMLVSINCITYNHEKYIEEALKSFLNQKTTFNFEIIIGEDCSTDKTKLIIDKYIEKYPDKIKLITSTNNVGARANSRRVFNASIGKYIAACEGDDYWIDENKLQKQVEYLEKNYDCGLVFNNTMLLDDKTKKIKHGNELKNGKYFIEDVILQGGGFIPTASIVYRKEIMIDPPELYTKASVGDYPLQLLCSLYGYMYCISDYMSVYRTNVQNSWTTNNYINVSKEKIIDRDKKIINILEMFDKYTNNNYKDIVKQAVQPFEYNIYLIENKISLSEMKKTKHYEYYKTMKFSKRVISLFKGKSTNGYLKLMNFKNLIQNKFKLVIK